jgi:formylglycine-generating enzyme required for sulfatase activity
MMYKTTTICAYSLMRLLTLGVCCSTAAASDRDVAANVTANDAGAAKQLTLDLGKGVTMKLVPIPAGKFKMGNHLSAEETTRRYGGQGQEQKIADECPCREVTISKPFYMGIHEVSQAQWSAVMGTEPWKDKTQTLSGDDYPASWVTSYDAIGFCRKLSEKTGRKVSLPTEAQWEYACRAGSETSFSFGDDASKIDEYAWNWQNARNAGEAYAHRVGQKKPNAWGLYDMHGNVWEVCSDWYDKDFYAKAPGVDPENTTETAHRCSRGGSWHNGASVARSSTRNSWTGPAYVHYNYGFRVVVAPDSKPNEPGK